MSGWDWVYELFPDRLLARGAMGKESQHFEAELQHCGDTPDRGVTTVLVSMHARFLILYGIVAAGTALFFGSVIVVTTVLDIRLPGNHKGTELIPFTVSLLFAELLAVALLARLLKKRRVQRYVTFKRVSDGGALLTLNSALDPDDTFEDFVAEVIAAIRRQRRPDASPDYSIQK